MEWKFQQKIVSWKIWVYQSCLSVRSSKSENWKILLHSSHEKFRLSNWNILLNGKHPCSENTPTVCWIVVRSIAYLTFLLGKIGLWLKSLAHFSSLIFFRSQFALALLNIITYISILCESKTREHFDLTLTF